MQIRRLQVVNVRNLSRISLRLRAINVFHGVNGSGKTSLLEAAHLLLMGKSFRHTQLKPLLSEGKDEITVFGELVSEEEIPITIGLSRQGDGSRPTLKLNGELINSLSELVQIAPIQVLSTDSIETLIGGPAHRRRFLDWGLFHVEPAFYPAWQLAQRALKQRNSLIRHGKIKQDQLAVWTSEYARYGEQVYRMRHAYIEQLLPIAQRIVGALLPQLGDGLDLQYLRGWPKDLTLSEALNQGLDGDLQQGYTRFGPHRADLRIATGSHSAADVLSRGQLKMLVATIYLAQAELLQSHGNKRSIFLIDDLAAELDDINRGRLCAEIERLKIQVLVTGIRRDELIDSWTDTDQVQVFHVEQGSINPINTTHY